MMTKTLNNFEGGTPTIKNLNFLAFPWKICQLNSKYSFWLLGLASLEPASFLVFFLIIQNQAPNLSYFIQHPLQKEIKETNKAERKRSDTISRK
jgi:hypothetical protein